MKRAALTFLLGFAVLVVAVLAAAAWLDTPDADPPGDGPGYLTASLQVAHRDDPLDVHVWQPASGGTPAWIGRNGLFLGHAVLTDTAPAPGPYPVVIMSHGSGGSGPRLGWLARELVSDGWIVLAPDHPGTMAGDSSPDATVRVWERAADLAAVAGAVENLLPDGATASPVRVALGFSLGGHTALAAAGARLSKPAFQAECAARDTYDCGWLARGGVDLGAIDAELYEADLSLPRIDAVVAIDPALAAAMTPDSLAAIDIPALVVSLGAPPPPALDATNVAAALPRATHVTLPETGHFAMLPDCSGLGRLILGLSVRDDENICATYPTDRAATQAEVAAQIVDALSPFSTP